MKDEDTQIPVFSLPPTKAVTVTLAFEQPSGRMPFGISQGAPAGLGAAAPAEDIQQFLESVLAVTARRVREGRVLQVLKK